MSGGFTELVQNMHSLGMATNGGWISCSDGQPAYSIIPFKSSKQLDNRKSSGMKTRQSAYRNRRFANNKHSSLRMMNWTQISFHQVIRKEVVVGI